jgi:hypothetical protein
MSEASDRTLLLLQELALLNETDNTEEHISAAARQKRRKEIREEIKQIAAEKQNQKH